MAASAGFEAVAYKRIPRAGEVFAVCVLYAAYMAAGGIVENMGFGIEHIALRLSRRGG